MQTIKNLATGRISLAQTFWGYGVCGNIILGLVGTSAINNEFLGFFILTLILKFLLFATVLSGITFIMRNGKITVWRILAFAVVLIEVIVGLIMAAALASVVF
ncbi:MAG TPA: hypothetical protein DDY57_11350 [Franconibacter pulveris]|nr:hypothetical protein [Franconibacter pulveris]